LYNINIDIANISNSKVYPWIFRCKDRSICTSVNLIYTLNSCILQNIIQRGIQTFL